MTVALVAAGQESFESGSGMLARSVGRIEVRVMLRVYAASPPTVARLDGTLTGTPEILTEHGRTRVPAAA
ncbi:hypothetical protein GCM10010488_04300 [Oerskovia jenensis]